jgi:hypothetical protein
MDFDSDRAGSSDEPTDEIPVKELEGSRPGVHDLDMRAGAHREVRKFERHVAAPDEDNARRQLFEVQKLCARGEQRFAGDSERSTLRARGENYETRLEGRATHEERRTADEVRAVVEHRDAQLAKAILAVCGDGFGEGALESHQLGPGDGEFSSGETPFAEPPTPIVELRSTDQDSLRVATALCARSAERTRVDDGDAATRLGTRPCYCSTSASARDDDDVDLVLLRHSGCPHGAWLLVETCCSRRVVTSSSSTIVATNRRSRSHHFGKHVIGRLRIPVGRRTELFEIDGDGGVHKHAADGTRHVDS